jgi:hypothetical protein
MLEGVGHPSQSLTALSATIDFSPNANWFFDAIPAQAGNAKIEQKAFEVASYGRQLGPNSF